MEGLGSFIRGEQISRDEGKGSRTSCQNLRSAVAKNALLTVADLFLGLNTQLDPEVGAVITTICKRFLDSSSFLNKAAEDALKEVIFNATDVKVLSSMLGLMEHRSASVRSKVSSGILTLLRKMGTISHISRELPKLMEMAGRAIQDSSPDVRSNAREIIRCLVRDLEIDRNILEQHIAAHVIAKALNEGTPRNTGMQPQRKAHSRSSNGLLVDLKQSMLHSPADNDGAETLQITARTHTVPIRKSRSFESSDAESQQLSELYRTMTSHDWRTRIDGVTTVRAGIEYGNCVGFIISLKFSSPVSSSNPLNACKRQTNWFKQLSV